MPGRFCRLVGLVSLSLAATTSRGQEAGRPSEPARTARNLAVAGGVGVAVASSNTDAVVLRGMIQPNLLKGGFGEELMNRYLARHLGKTTGYRPVQARIGSQGIDGLMIRTDAAGRPTGLIVAEAKYGTSRLGSTGDGIQMGKEWRSARLGAMGGHYRSIARSIDAGRMTTAGAGGSVGQQRLQVDLPGGKAAVFTRSASHEPWEYVGPRRLLGEAGRQADRVGAYLQQASRGEVAYESVICRIKFKGDALHVQIKDASLLGPELGEAKLASRTLKFPLDDRQLGGVITIARSRVARQLRTKLPHLGAGDVDAYAKQIVRTGRDLDALLNNRPTAVRWAIAQTSVRVGGAAALDVAAQVITQSATTGRVRWSEVAVSGGIAFGSGTLGAAAGQATTAWLVGSPLGQQLVARSSAVLGAGSARLLPRLLGGTVGGGVTAVLFAIGGYATGTYDSTTAARMGVSGVSSTMLGLATSGGLFALATTFGTASTGTAIASLHGAVAFNAAMAWLGGGTIAAGGFGMAGGAVVMTGGFAIVAIGTGVLINYGWSFWDERTDLQRIQLTIDRLARKTNFVSAGAPARGFSTTRIKAQ